MSRKNQYNKKKIMKVVKKVGTTLMYCTVFAMMIEMDSLANSSDIVANSMSGFQDILKSFVTAVGSMITLWGIFEWGNSMQTNDGMQQSAAFKRIGGGLIMCIAPTILTSII